VISSTSNPLVKRARSLRQRKARRREGAFVVEGPRGFLAAVESGARIEAVLHAPDLLTSDLVAAAILRLAAGGTRVEELSKAVFERMSERDNPTGIAAIVTDPVIDAADMPARAKAVYVALVGVSDPGNLGAVTRTVDAVGGDGLLLVGDTTDPTHPTAVKASMGALFTVPCARLRDLEALLEWSRDRGLTAVGTSAHAERGAWQIDLRPPLLLVMGPEREGLDGAALAALDSAVSLPMKGGATSLNLAVATGALLYESLRQSEARREG